MAYALSQEHLVLGGEKVGEHDSIIPYERCEVVVAVSSQYDASRGLRRKEECRNVTSDRKVSFAGEQGEVKYGSAWRL